MYLFLKVLDAFPGELSIETKVLGLLNNIAEVKELRRNLMVDPFINLLRFDKIKSCARISCLGNQSFIPFQQADAL